MPPKPRVVAGGEGRLKTVLVGTLVPDTEKLVDVIEESAVIARYLVKKTVSSTLTGKERRQVIMDARVKEFSALAPNLSKDIIRSLVVADMSD